MKKLLCKLLGHKLEPFFKTSFSTIEKCSRCNKTKLTIDVSNTYFSDNNILTQDELEQILLENETMTMH